MNQYPFASVDTLRVFFVDGLKRLMRKSSESLNLDQFVLVLANALFDPGIYEQTKDQLENTFTNLRSNLSERLKSGVLLSDADDDQLVFLKLCLMGWENLKPVELKKVGPWKVQFNQLRSFRPRRHSVEKITSLKKDFDQNAFHFNKESLNDERFWSGVIAGKKTVLFYNKFPFVQIHLNVVPECEQNKPHFLTQEFYEYAWEFSSEMSGLDGFGLGYNSLGAFASVNHLHFQMHLEGKLPVAQDNWRHNGGRDEYPLTCYTSTSVNDSWKLLRDFHKRSIAYNLLITPGKVFCFPRKFQGTYAQPDWTSGFAWYELSGGFLVFSRKEYDSFAEEKIPTIFNELRIPDKGKSHFNT